MQVKDTNKFRHDIVVLGVVCLVLQLALSPYIAIADGHANFAFVFSACVALTIGGPTGVGAGFLAGLLFDLGATNPVGLMAFLLTGSSYLLGIENRNKLSDDPQAAFVNGVIACLAVSALYSLAMLLTGDASSLVDVVVMRALPSFLLTTIASIPFYLVFSRPQTSAAGLSRTLGTRMPRQQRHGLGQRRWGSRGL